jgi:hypothetical protein
MLLLLLLLLLIHLCYGWEQATDAAEDADSAGAVAGLHLDAVAEACQSCQGQQAA